MIKVEMTKKGLHTEGSGDNAQLLTEFTAIVENLIRNDVLDKDLYEMCWNLATKEGEERTEYMKEELIKSVKEGKHSKEDIEEKVDELMNMILN